VISRLQPKIALHSPPDGLIYIFTNGGSDHQVLKTVNIHAKGIVRCFLVSPAIHTEKADKKNQLKSVICSLTQVVKQRRG
jgi:hypothetical protein